MMGIAELPNGGRTTVVALALAIAWAIVVNVGLDDITPSRRPAPATRAPETKAPPQAVAPAPAKPAPPTPAPTKPAAAGSHVKPTTVADLPELTSREPYSLKWDGSDGVSAQSLSAPSPIANRSVLALTAVATDGLHRVGIQIGNLEPDRTYRVSAWVKVAPAVRLLLDIRDGAVVNQSMTKFDPVARSVLTSEGKSPAQGVQPGSDGWTRLWADLRSSDGQIFVYVGLLGGSDAAHFVGAGQQMTFGGVEIARN